MTEREALTVFRTIQKCRHQALHTNDCGNCERCQYYHEQEQIDGAVALAISALEKQEQTKEAIPHRNYQYLSDYWCECGWHLGKYNDVKFCANCGRKINWEKRKYKLPEPYTEEEDE